MVATRLRRPPSSRMRTAGTSHQACTRDSRTRTYRHTRHRPSRCRRTCSRTAGTPRPARTAHTRTCRFRRRPYCRPGSRTRTAGSPHPPDSRPGTRTGTRRRRCPACSTRRRRSCARRSTPRARCPAPPTRSHQPPRSPRGPRTRHTGPLRRRHHRDSGRPRGTPRWRSTRTPSLPRSSPCQCSGGTHPTRRTHATTSRHRRRHRRDCRRNRRPRARSQLPARSEAWPPLDAASYRPLSVRSASRVNRSATWYPCSARSTHLTAGTASRGRPGSWLLRTATTSVPHLPDPWAAVVVCATLRVPLAMPRTTQGPGGHSTPVLIRPTREIARESPCTPRGGSAHDDDAGRCAPRPRAVRTGKGVMTAFSTRPALRPNIRRCPFLTDRPPRRLRRPRGATESATLGYGFVAYEPGATSKSVTLVK